jgi:hypothetical protein
MPELAAGPRHGELATSTKAQLTPSILAGSKNASASAFRPAVPTVCGGRGGGGGGRRGASVGAHRFVRPQRQRVRIPTLSRGQGGANTHRRAHAGVVGEEQLRGRLGRACRVQQRRESEHAAHSYRVGAFPKCRTRAWTRKTDGFLIFLCDNPSDKKTLRKKSCKICGEDKKGSARVVMCRDVRCEHLRVSAW